jgi:glutamate--cysteine ligase
MSTRKAVEGEEPRIESRAQLLAPMEEGAKPAGAWRIGTEHEKLVYALSDHHAPSYEEAGGIRALLNGLTRYGWEPIVEGGNVIALEGPDGNVSLEPAGQLELSGAPLENLHQTCAETARHLEQVKAVGGELGIGLHGHGSSSRRVSGPMPRARNPIPS